MLKYVDTAVTLREIPNEITLCINISNCPCHCKGCHSSYLAEDIGTELGWYDCIAKEGKSDSLYKLILANKGITCVAFMGGDSDPKYINYLAHKVKYGYHLDITGIRTAWYSGRQELSKCIELENFDYIKLGPYIEELGPLNSPTTNQRLYEVKMCKEIDELGNPIYGLEDITNLFWKEQP